MKLIRYTYNCLLLLVLCCLSTSAAHGQDFTDADTLRFVDALQFRMILCTGSFTVSVSTNAKNSFSMASR